LAEIYFFCSLLFVVCYLLFDFTVIGWHTSTCGINRRLGLGTKPEVQGRPNKPRKLVLGFAMGKPNLQLLITLLYL